MPLRRIALLFLLCVGAPAFGIPVQDLQRIQNRNRPVAVPGLSVLPPQGEDWFLFPVSKQEGIPATGLIRFVQRLSNTPPRKPEEARSVVASAIVQDSERENPGTPVEFLQGFTGADPERMIGQMITARQRLIGFEAALDNSAGAICVRYTRVTEIMGQFPAFPDLVAITSARGLYCSHPQWPRYYIDVTYQQIYAKGQAPLPRDEEADVFLKGVVFTSDRPSAVNSAR